VPQTKDPKPPKPDPDPEPPDPLPGPEPDEPGPDVIDPVPAEPLWVRNLPVRPEVYLAATQDSRAWVE
jgi:hypothetical protein